FTTQIECGAKDPDLVFGLYDGAAVNPTLLEVFPAEATTGWFAVVSYRENPTRVVVHVFDGLASPRGSTTTPGGNRYSIGAYITGPQGTWFTEDSRNPGASPQALLFAGTGLNYGSFWMAWEGELPSPAANRDFFNAVMFFEGPSIGVPVQATTWG